MSKLVAQSITKYYDGAPVIEDISLHLEKGEAVCLLGTSGAGKTTLFHLLAGLLTPEKGQVFLQGEEITGQKGHLSYMLQKDLLLPYRKVVDNVALPLIIKGESPAAAREKAAQLFGPFGLEGYEEKWPHQLSGGMRQRAALLRTYLFSQDVVLLDEPFSALDTITKSALHTWYLQMMERLHLSTLFITHDIDEAILLSNRVYILTGRPGRIRGEVKINPPCARGQEFVLTPEFLAYKREILALLAQSE